MQVALPGRRLPALVPARAMFPALELGCEGLSVASAVFASTTGGRKRTPELQFTLATVRLRIRPRVAPQSANPGPGPHQPADGLHRLEKNGRVMTGQAVSELSAACYGIGAGTAPFSQSPGRECAAVLADSYWDCGGLQAVVTRSC